MYRSIVASDSLPRFCTPVIILRPILPRYSDPGPPPSRQSAPPSKPAAARTRAGETSEVSEDFGSLRRILPPQGRSEDRLLPIPPRLRPTHKLRLMGYPYPPARRSRPHGLAPVAGQ